MSLLCECSHGHSGTHLTNKYWPLGAADACSRARAWAKMWKRGAKLWWQLGLRFRRQINEHFGEREEIAACALQARADLDAAMGALRKTRDALGMTMTGRPVEAPFFTLREEAIAAADAVLKKGES